MKKKETKHLNNSHTIWWRWFSSILCQFCSSLIYKLKAKYKTNKQCKAI